MAYLAHRVIINKNLLYLHSEITFHANVHNMNIRRKDLFSIPPFRLSIFKRSISNVYNSSPDLLMPLKSHIEKYRCHKIIEYQF